MQAFIFENDFSDDESRMILYLTQNVHRFNKMC